MSNNRIELIKSRLSFDYKRINKGINVASKSEFRPVPLALKSASNLLYDDLGFASAWWVDDKPKIEEIYFKKIRRLSVLFSVQKEENLRSMTANPYHYHSDPYYNSTLLHMNQLRMEKHKVIEEFEERLKRAFDDKTIEDGLKPPYLTVQHNEIELTRPVVADSHDMMVNDGMERFALLICNESNSYFLFYAVGASSIPSGVGQTQLYDEKARAPVDEFGWFSSIGTLIRGGAEFPETVPSFLISESAPFDTATAGTMAWRTAYPSPVQHTKDNTFPVASHVVYQIPSGANSS